MIIQRIICLIVILCFATIKGNSETFVVTSNADSGPGTLREAITLANMNGIASSDTVIFNINDISRNGRTIVLNSELPDLTSNIVIDASTQSGINIGVSESKIILLINTPQLSTFTFFKFNNASNIELYGIFLFNEVSTLFSTYMPVNGIVFTKSSNIIIGKAGKGNYFRGLRFAIHSPIATSDAFYLPNSSDITIQANIFNNNENGDPNLDYNNQQNFIDPIEYAIRLHNTKNIKIGGDFSNERNSITAQNILIQSNLTTDNGFFILKNNYIGIRTDGSVPIQTTSPKTFIVIRGSYSNNTTDYIINIINNKINGHIEIAYLSKYLKIQGNKIFDTGGFSSNVDFTIKLLIEFCTGGGIIGGELPEEQNEIYTNGPMNYYNSFSTIPTGAIWINVSPNILIRKNRTYCTSQYGAGIKVLYFSNEPHIQIDSLGNGFVKGKATPGSRIEVFLDDDCWGCDGEVLLGITMANPDSSWSFSGNFNGVVIATATKDDISSSGYTEPIYEVDKVKLNQPTCGLNNGSITGIKLIRSWNNVEWHKTFLRNGNIVDTIISTEVDLKNVGEGNYYFVAKLGETCRSGYFAFSLYNYTPKINNSNQQIINPSCGQSNGSIFGLTVIEGDFSLHTWVNDLGLKFPGSNFGNIASINNLFPGRYRLIITDTIAGCADTSIWYNLINQSGPQFSINNIQITHSTCGNNNGSITGIDTSNITGAPFIQWLDSLNKPVSSLLNPTNITAGKYKMKFKDQSGCDTIITPFYTVQGLGVIGIDSSQMIVNGSNCVIASGTITGLSVMGATSYQWVNSSGQTIGTTLVPGNVYPGAYVLHATNSYGCVKRTDTIRVPVNATMAFNPPLQIQSTSGKCDQADGFINISNFPNSQGYTFKWVDSLQPNVVIGNSLNLVGINSGRFMLYASNANGCEQKIIGVNIPYLPPPSLNAIANISDEICNNQQGSIIGLGVMNGTGIAPFTYSWYNGSNNLVSTQQDLTNIGQGSYYLLVRDNSGCNDTSNSFQVRNTTLQLNNPKYDDQYIRINTSVTLTTLNPQQTTYLLFDNLTSNIPIQQNKTGVFILSPLTSNKSFYVQLQVGDCYSQKVPVKIYVYDKTKVYVPSAFTPNKDGLNDVLKVKTFGIISLEFFKVYNKYGQLVFSTNDLSKGWDGTIKGIMQSSSTFVWMLKAKDEITGESIFKKGTTVLIR